MLPPIIKALDSVLYPYILYHTIQNIQCYFENKLCKRFVNDKRIAFVQTAEFF